MASKKGQTHNERKIFDYVKKKDPEFAGAIRHLGLERALIPGKHSGVTFLYPMDAALRNEIVEKAYGNPVSTKLAVKDVESLILPVVYLRSSDFDHASVGSRLEVKFDVKSIARGRVEFAGFELTPAEDFNLGANRDGTRAVWLISKGRPPLTGETYKAPARQRKATKGGNEHHTYGGDDELSSRQLLATNTESEYNRCMQLDKCKFRDPYMTKVTSLLSFLKAHHPEVLLSITPIVDVNFIITFYLLFEPYKKKGPFLISDEVLYGTEGWNEAVIKSNGVAEYNDFFNTLCSSDMARVTSAAKDGEFVVPYIFREPAVVTTEVNEIRKKLARLNGTEALAQEVQDAYVKLIDNNTINDNGPMFPDSTNTAIGTGIKKLWQDEFRLIFSEKFTHLAKTKIDPQWPVTFNTIIQHIRIEWPGNDYSAELRICNPARIHNLPVSMSESAEAVKAFIKSTDFLYKPVAPTQIGKSGGTLDCDDPRVYNRNLKGFQSLGRMYKSEANENYDLDQPTLERLKAHLARGGTLPEDIMKHIMIPL